MSPRLEGEGQSMDVQVDSDLIRSERENRAWSQEHLAGAAGIGARTIQRVEATGVASYESLRAISAALEIPVAKLRREDGSRDVAPRAPRLRLRFFLRWLGAAVALALFAGSSGFFLLKDYQKVRVLRTVEQWVTDTQPSPHAANPTL
jgi:transcriptional regulator with XRE-family HTH domain